MYARVINFTLLAPSLWTVVQTVTSVETVKGHTILLFKSSENSGVIVELFSNIKMAGEELLKKLRKKTSLPVIFLTSKDDEIDELLGLKLGADDFVKKSGGFSIKVLIERIRVQLRKKDTKDTIEENKSIISHGKLKLDPSQLECEWNGKQLPDKLTTTEFLLVKELAKRPGIIKERAQLMDIAYREDTDIEDRTIDSHVKRIRKKFKKVDPDFSAIETRYGSGYRWNVS